MSMHSLDKRQIIILAAFCLPLFVLIFVSYSGTGSAPKPAEKRPVITNPTAAASKSLQKPVQIIPKSVEIQRVKGLLKEAEAMSAQEYLEKQKTDSTLTAPNLDIRRGRLARRIGQLENMTPAQWEAEQRAGIVLAPSPSKAKGVIPSTQTDEKLPDASDVRNILATPVPATPPATNR
jgi:predicted transcriptional regulator